MGKAMAWAVLVVLGSWGMALADGVRAQREEVRDLIRDDAALDIWDQGWGEGAAERGANLREGGADLLDGVPEPDGARDYPLPRPRNGSVRIPEYEPPAPLVIDPGVRAYRPVDVPRPRVRDTYVEPRQRTVYDTDRETRDRRLDRVRRADRDRAVEFDRSPRGPGTIDLRRPRVDTGADTLYRLRRAYP